MFGFPDQAVGAIVAALIAGVVALLGLIISKEAKVSEFRQQWIDALRSGIAAVIRHGHSISTSTLLSIDRDSRSNNLREDFAGMIEAAARIRLRLNFREKESAAFTSKSERAFC